MHDEKLIEEIEILLDQKLDCLIKGVDKIEESMDRVEASINRIGEMRG